MRGRQVSPVEIVQAVLARIERVDPEINAFVRARCRRRAGGGAACGGVPSCAATPLGPLHGVPVTIKDIQAVKGMPTRRGSRLTPAEPAAADAPVVARLRAAGAVILGKTTLTEHGWTAVSDSPLTGATRNPWNHGIDLGRLVVRAPPRSPRPDAARCTSAPTAPARSACRRISAAWSVSSRPSAWFPNVPVPNNGALSHIGPIARDVADAELMLAVMSGPHPADLTTSARPV